MSNNNLKVEVKGLSELRAAFNQVDRGLTKELKADFKSIAEMVVRATAEKVPHKTGAAAGSLRARGTAKGASIAFGGSAAPYEPWLDFGGKVGRKKSIDRPFIKEGRYLYPTIKEKNAEIIKAVDQAIARVAKEAGFDTH